MSAETVGAAILMLLSLPMLGPMLVVALLLYLTSIILDHKEESTNE